MSERKYISDAETWNIYVGNITPKEFMGGYDNPIDAVQNYINKDYPFGDDKPSWLRGSLVSYIESNEIDWFEGALGLAEAD